LRKRIKLAGQSGPGVELLKRVEGTFRHRKLSGNLAEFRRASPVASC
jgi:hypothetical protein